MAYRRANQTKQFYSNPINVAALRRVYQHTLFRHCMCLKIKDIVLTVEIDRSGVNCRFDATLQKERVSRYSVKVSGQSFR